MKIIKTKGEYKKALTRADELIDIDPEVNSELADELELLVLLINKYEEEHYKIDMPTPIEMIKFRMEEQGLTQKDLIPYIGSKSKVSEVLNGKRELSLKMIRALNKHLEISADVLLQESPVKDLQKYSDIDFEKFPVEEMQRIGAFDGLGIENVKDKAEEAICLLIEKIGGMEIMQSVLYRKAESTRVTAKADRYALQGWCMAVLSRASEIKTKTAFSRKKLTKTFLQGLVALSTLQKGAYAAIEYLANHGIKLILLPHLKRTYLDGASFLTKDGSAVIGLTLRFDRIDYYWFTLLHEIGHLCEHLNKGEFIADDMSLRDSNIDSDIEKEADAFAEQKLLPDFNPDLSEKLTNDELYNYAEHYNVHPAIVAGQIQYKLKNYKLFSNIINKEKIERPW